jgi:hypothetical protein
MYTKAETSQLRQAFWTTFGQYMSPVLSADGLPVNWVNYKTGIKHVYFKMQADNRHATIAIELTHPDAGIRELFFEQFLEVKTLLEEAVGEEWIWEREATDTFGAISSRIYRELRPANIFNRDNWPELITFFKPRIIALDEFWSSAQYAFDELR